MTTEPYDQQKLIDHARQLAEALARVSDFIRGLQINLNLASVDETRVSRRDVEYYSDVAREALLLVLKPYDSKEMV